MAFDLGSTASKALISLSLLGLTTAEAADSSDSSSGSTLKYVGTSLAVVGLTAAGIAARMQPTGKKHAPALLSVESPAPKKEGETAARRSIYSPEKLTQVEENSTVEAFLKAAAKYPTNRCLGRRLKTKDGATDFYWQSYEEVAARTKAFGAGCEKLNLIPEVDGMKMLAFYLKNSPEWAIASYGILRHRGVTVPLYDTLGPETVCYILNQTQLTSILCTEEELSKVFQSAPNCPSLKNVVLIAREAPEESRKKAQELGLSLYLFEEVEAYGRLHPCADNLPSVDDVATFCYTSGTTGDAKGALLTHRNILANVTATGKLVNLTEKDVHLSYLPLAHIFERCVMVSVLISGGSVGFYQGITTQLPSDLATLRPTLFPSVPRLLNRIYDKIVGTALSAGGVKSFLFKKAMQAKLDGLHKGYTLNPLWDKLVFSKLSAKIGLDRCRVMITGSAPIAPHVLEFYRIALPGCIVIEGYGQTETAAAGTLQHLDDLTVGHVGIPHPCVEVKLVDVPEMGYLSTDTMHEPGTEQELACMGRGEICVRGGGVFKGYYKMPEKTAETIDEDGWLHSGDIGLWTKNGNLKIVDRKKNIFKLSQGEYVAPEKIENAYTKSSLVAQVFVYGDSLQHFLVGIIVPDEEYVRTIWAPKNGLEGKSIAEICASSSFRAAVQEDLKAIGKQEKLNGYEQVKDFFLEPVPFSLENDLLTPTFKLKRNDAKKHYKPQIEGMYAKSKITLSS